MDTRNDEHARNSLGILPALPCTCRTELRARSPRAAFNRGERRESVLDRQLFEAKTWEQYLAAGTLHKKGTGRFSLCGMHNNMTGRLYAKAFGSFAYQAMEIIQSRVEGSVLKLPFWISPLAVSKQVVSMFLSINQPGFAQRFDDLVTFVLDPRSIGISRRFGLYCFLTRSPLPILAGFMAQAHHDRRAGSALIYSMVSAPPLGFMLTYDSPKPNPRELFYDMTEFTRASVSHGVPHWMPRHIWMGMPVHGKNYDSRFFCNVRDLSDEEEQHESLPASKENVDRIRDETEYVQRKLRELQ